MNKRDRSKITAEIKTIEPMVQESMQAFDAYGERHGLHKVALMRGVVAVERDWKWIL